MGKIRLGVNIDHVATVRNARGEKYPSPLRAALIAQKNGAVTSQIRIGKDKSLYTRSARLPNETANLLLGCDAVVSVSPSITRTLNPDKTIAIINGRVEPVGVAGVHIGTVVDDSLLNYTLVQYPDGMEISSNGLISWNPNQGIYTSDIVEVKVGYDGIVMANAKSSPTFKVTRKDIFLSSISNFIFFFLFIFSQWINHDIQ